MGILLAILLIMAAATSGGADAGTADRHAGYYYPEITSSEIYRARAQILPDASREMRIGFIVLQTAEQAKRPYPPRFAIFAKGEKAQKLIIVGLDGESFRTLFRARGVLAQLTARARGTELFRNLAVEDVFTFFDLARMLGFEQITITDGELFAHRITMK